MRMLLRTATLLVTTAAAVGLAPAAIAVEAPDWEAPFACGTEWSAGSRDGHSPSWYSVDFNAADDEGAPVLATAGGQVTKVRDLGSSSYGLHVEVDHGGGWTSMYAHLQAAWVVQGQWLDQGDFVGLLGTSGGSSGPHLHFEENLDRANQHAWFHGVRLRYNSTITAEGCGDVPAVGDWNADGRTDLGTFRRTAVATFQRLRPAGSVQELALGASTDLAVIGDWDGNGTDDAGVWSKPTRTFSLRSTARTTTSIVMGRRKDLPLSGDWNGDGRSEVGVYRPDRGVFRTRADDGTVTTHLLGDASSTPVTGDWDGDGRTDLGVYDQGTGSWQLRSTLTGKITLLTWGGPGRLPVTGDWDGNGVTDVGVWKPATAVFRLRTGSAEGALVVTRFGADRSNP
jgi:hypothetical protein